MLKSENCQFKYTNRVKICVTQMQYMHTFKELQSWETSDKKSLSYF